jgi:hypothetical protein
MSIATQLKTTNTDTFEMFKKMVSLYVDAIIDRKSATSIYIFSDGSSLKITDTINNTVKIEVIS